MYLPAGTFCTITDMISLLVGVMFIPAGINCYCFLYQLPRIFFNLREGIFTHIRQFLNHSWPERGTLDRSRAAERRFLPL